MPSVARGKRAWNAATSGTVSILPTLGDVHEVLELLQVHWSQSKRVVSSKSSSTAKRRGMSRCWTA